MSEDDGVDRRRLVRILLVLAIAVPLLIEGVTFLGLVSHSFGDGGDDPGTATQTPAGVGVGDDLLADTARAERITTASVGQTDAGWQFVLTVQVKNTGDAPYELELGDVRTSEGTTVEGTATTGQLEPGETTTVTGSWLLPEGERPSTVEATSITFGSDGPERTTETVHLKTVPVQG